MIDAVERASRGGDGVVVAGRLGLPIGPIWPRPQDMTVTDGLVGPEYGRGNGEDEVQHAWPVTPAGTDRQLRWRPRGLREVAGAPEPRQKRTMVAGDFARKLGVVLKAINLSRGRLAQTVGVDKSVVSRWASGVQVPSDHNLSLLTAAVARHRPGFKRRDWDLDAEGLANRLDALNGGASSLERPSIAVLPFENMSGDPEQGYFADGITEDVTTALSHIPSLFVIARNSSFAYKGKAIDIRHIGRELGVRYVLEGSVRKAGQRLRITGQLVEVETGSHLWADRFDSVLEDVFDLQDQVAMAVAGAMEPSITQAEIRRANRKPTENLQAYDWLLRALGEHQLFARDSCDRAIAMARRAIELDPRYAQAYAYLAVWTHQRKNNGWMEDEAAETTEGVRFANLAVQLAPNDSVVLSHAALAVGHLNRDLESAIPWLDRAIALNANSAHAFGRGAIVRTVAGDYATAIDHADRAMRLSPFDPYSFAFSVARGASQLLQRQLPEAVTWLRKAAQQNPRNAPTFLYLGSALAHGGQMEEARAAIRRLLELHPTNTVSWQRQRRPVPEDDIEYLLKGARLAGLPE